MNHGSTGEHDPRDQVDVITRITTSPLLVYPSHKITADFPSSNHLYNLTGVVLYVSLRQLTDHGNFC